MEIVYVMAMKEKERTGGFYIKTEKGYIPIKVQTGVVIEKFGGEAQEFKVDVSQKGEVITDGLKRVEIKSK